jgi:nucleoside-diphosphate-sugar epimerase
VSEGHVLITGAAGLIGAAARRLLEAQGRPVVAVDRETSVVEGRPVEACDVTDPHALHSVARRATLSGVLHCGAFSGPMVAADRPLAMVEVNIGGTGHVLELARRVGDVRVVFCSSTSAVGPTGPGVAPIPEAIPLNPSTVYGASKAAGEALVGAYARQFGVDGVSLRLSWVYGPRRATACVIRAMLEDAMAGRPTRLPWGADFPRQYIHVDDAAAALVAALDRPRLPQSVYFATGDDHRTLGAVADVVRRVEPAADITLAEGPDPGDDRQDRFDISAASRDLGWAPRIGFEEGVRAYRDWLRARQGEARA